MDGPTSAPPPSKNHPMPWARAFGCQSDRAWHIAARIPYSGWGTGPRCQLFSPSKRLNIAIERIKASLVVIFLQMFWLGRENRCGQDEMNFRHPWGLAHLLRSQGIRPERYVVLQPVAQS